MRTLAVCMVSLLLWSCHPNRVMEQNVDFEQRSWWVGHKPSFPFTITEPNLPYEAYLYLRNERSYPYANIYITWYLKDSVGNVLEKKMVKEELFDRKTGKPLGDSGIGDIFEHPVPLLQDYRFPHPGDYSIELEQFMRMDSLKGMISATVIVERSEKE